MICHAGAPHAHNAIDRGCFGVLCSRCWMRLLALEGPIGDAARAQEARQR